MRWTKLSRVIAVAGLAVLLGSSGLAPARAASAPVITWSGSVSDGAQYVFGAVPEAPTCTAVDEIGEVPCQVTGYQTSVGTHILTATAISADQTSAEATMSYQVLAWRLDGFYRPVRMDGIWNKVKGGATVPLKFRIYAGEVQSKATSDISGFTAQQVSCADGTSLGAAVSAIGSYHGGKLKYSDGKFVLNWKAPKPAKVTSKGKGKAGSFKKVAVSTCYQITMTAGDGSSLNALFKVEDKGQ